MRKLNSEEKEAMKILWNEHGWNLGKISKAFKLKVSDLNKLRNIFTYGEGSD